MTPDSARDDLAFLRALVDQPESGFQRGFSQTYAAAGGCYGAQMLLHVAQYYLGWFQTPVSALLVGLLPTVVFVLMLVVILRRNRLRGASTVSRAVGAAFSAVGVANLVLIVAIGSLALREKSLTIWLLYPTTVIILQGAAWLVAFMLRRRPWMGWLAAGWFATGVGMALSIETQGVFILVLGLSFFAFMLAPGLFLMRQNRAA
ncbi:MAG TPA: hypothetical protein VFH92_08165 [Phenylobacterium sp.]|nr:hypothetical protein [Phenylobacterium sp.]